VLRPDDTPQSVIERADECLYGAKRHSRNRVILRVRSRGRSRRDDGGMRRA
jgi:hypothetical protein